MTHVTALSYEVVEGWEQLPAGYFHPDVPAVAVDSLDRVYLFCRSVHPVMVYDRNGTFLKSWGEGLFTTREHGITVGPDDMVYCTDDGDHTVRKFTPDGELLMTLGTSGQPSDTGYVPGDLLSVRRGGPPFNHPTNLAVGLNGDLYVSDGYGNARVHRFSARGELRQSWGEPGAEPGQFHNPHGLWVHPDGRVFVADRSNNRIQIFSPDGEFLEMWTDTHRPEQIFIDRDGLVYVGEGAWRAGMILYRDGQKEVITPDTSRPPEVCVRDSQGNVLTRWGGPEPCVPGNFCSPHGISVDSYGDIYVAECTWSFSARDGLVPPDCKTFQKFARKD